MAPQRKYRLDPRKSFYNNMYQSDFVIGITRDMEKPQEKICKYNEK